MMTFHHSALIFWILSFFVSLSSYYIYYTSILAGKTKPHVFSWLLWGLISLVVCIIQFMDAAGIGALNTLLIAGLCLGIAGVALKKWEHSISLGDKLSFTAGMLAILLWLITDTPLYSVIILITIDLFGFIPTFIKSYENPYSEDYTAYIIAFFGYALSLGALSHISFLTAGFVGITALLNISLAGVIYIRRFSVGETMA